MKNIYSKLTSFIASTTIATTVIVTTAQSAQTAQVTQKFEGPVNYVEVYFENETDYIILEDFLTGSVSFEPNVSPVDISSFGDLGDRLLYPDAIVDFNFSTGVFEWSFQGGDIDLWNDYQRCTARRTRPLPMVCLQRKLEREQLFFWIDSSTEDSTQLVSLGIHGNSADFLTSSLLPTTPPKDFDIAVVNFHFLWILENEEKIISIDSNNIKLVRESIPEPAFVWGLLTIVFLVTGSVLKKTVQKNCSK